MADDQARNDFEMTPLTLSGAPGIIDASHDITDHAVLEAEDKKTQEAEKRFREFLRNVVLPRRIERGWQPLFGAWLSTFDKVVRTDEYKQLYGFLYELYQSIERPDDFAGILLLSDDAITVSLKGNTFIVQQPGQPMLEFFWTKEGQKEMFGKLCDQMKARHQICLSMKTEPNEFWANLHSINVEYYWMMVVKQFFNIVKSMRFLGMIELLESDYLRQFEPKDEHGYAVPEFKVVDHDGAEVWWDEKLIVARSKDQKSKRPERFSVTNTREVERFAKVMKPSAESLFDTLPRTKEQFYLAVMDNYPEA